MALNIKNSCILDSFTSFVTHFDTKTVIDSFTNSINLTLFLVTK